MTTTTTTTTTGLTDERLDWVLRYLREQGRTHTFGLQIGLHLRVHFAVVEGPEMYDQLLPMLEERGLTKDRFEVMPGLLIDRWSLTLA